MKEAGAEATEGLRPSSNTASVPDYNQVTRSAGRM